jgi:endonuclease/exonuclease/phosphatase family metal-dependent hydrolase
MKHTLPLAILWTLLLLVGCSPSRSTVDGIVLRVITYNIHHGEGIDGTVDIDRIAKLILDTKADIVALQEVDRGVERTKKIDIMTLLADKTGMTYAFGKNLDYQGGDYGNGVLTRFPILEERNLHYTMIRDGEQRGLLQLVLDVRGQEVVVLNTHIDYRPDDRERVMNVGEIRAAITRYRPRPVIVCGDFNDVPSSRTILLMREELTDVWDAVGAGEGLTYPTVKPEKRIDYIFVTPATGSAAVKLRPISATVLRSEASDHLPVLVELLMTNN